MDEDNLLCEPEPVLCYNCGGSGLHPYAQACCPVCNGTGHLTDDVYDDIYKRTVYRAHQNCF